MAKLTEKDVLHVAKLAKLDLKDSEIERYTTQLSNVLDHFKELDGVDTKDIEPTNQTTGLENVMRTDEIKVGNSFTQEEAVSGSDNIHNGYFKVKAILSERTDK